MALKEEETSSSDDEEESGADEDDNVNESDEGEDDTDDEEVEEEEKVSAAEKSAKTVVKTEGVKLDKAGLNEFLTKLRRPITQAKVMLNISFVSLTCIPVTYLNPYNWKVLKFHCFSAGACDPQVD